MSGSAWTWGTKIIRSGIFGARCWLNKFHRSGKGPQRDCRILSVERSRLPSCFPPAAFLTLGARALDTSGIIHLPPIGTIYP